MTTGDDEPPAPGEEKRQDRLRILDLSAVGLAFPISLLLGYFGGRVVGGWLGSVQTGGMIGALVGIVGGFYNLFKMVSRLAPRGHGASAAAGAPPPPRSGSTSEGDAADLGPDEELNPEEGLDPDDGSDPDEPFADEP